MRIRRCRRRSWRRPRASAGMRSTFRRPRSARLVPSLPHSLTSSLPHSLSGWVRSHRSPPLALLAFAGLVCWLGACGGGGEPPKETVVEVQVSFQSVVPATHLPATLCGTITMPAENALELTGVVLIPGTEELPREGTVSSVALL